MRGSKSTVQVSEPAADAGVTELMLLKVYRQRLLTVLSEKFYYFDYKDYLKNHLDFCSTDSDYELLFKTLTVIDGDIRSMEKRLFRP